MVGVREKKGEKGGRQQQRDMKLYQSRSTLNRARCAFELVKVFLSQVGFVNTLEYIFLPLNVNTVDNFSCSGISGWRDCEVGIFETGAIIEKV